MAPEDSTDFDVIQFACWMTAGLAGTIGWHPIDRDSKSLIINTRACSSADRATGFEPCPALPIYPLVSNPVPH